KLLADFGAEVIKVEPPGTGDPARQEGPFQHDIPNPETSGLFLYLNTNKKSITLNLKTATGKKILKQLVKDADVLVENFEPRVLASLGLSYETLREINPRLVMTSISNFGQTGPYRDYKATNLTLAAWGGGIGAMGEAGREPVAMGGSQAEYMGGIVGYIATMGAVIGQHKDGIGQHVDLSIHECVASNLQSAEVSYVYMGMVRGRSRTRFTTGHPVGVYPCKDGYVNVTPGLGGMPSLALLIGRPELAEHEWFTNHRLRQQHAKEFDEQFLLPYLMTHGRHEIVDFAQTLRMPFTTAVTIDELLEEPQFQARNFMAEVEHPEAGKVVFPGTIAKLSETPGQVTRAPLLGEHNEEILGGRLGYSKEDLVRMRERDVI
ncbi:MAG: CoA transferase, partial [Chloroflexi bacterium]|nr:CoA transferase [Chloroflexota bacterium]